MRGRRGKRLPFGEPNSRKPGGKRLKVVFFSLAVVFFDVTRIGDCCRLHLRPAVKPYYPDPGRVVFVVVQHNKLLVASRCYRLVYQHNRKPDGRAEIRPFSGCRW